MSDLDINTVLLRLEMLSHGSVQAWNASGGHSGEPDDKIITLILRHDEPPHLTYRRRYLEAFGDDGRARVLTAANKELEAWTCRDQDKSPERVVTLDGLVLEEGKGYDPKIVAQRFNVSEALVRRIRLKHNRQIDDGKEIITTSRADWATSLAERGHSQAQIAQKMGISQPTVHRLLKARRFKRDAA